MASKELIEQIETVLEAAFVQEDNFTVTAKAILTTILAALQEPSEEMREAGIEAIDDNWERGVMRPAGNSSITCWRAMLNASPLGEQSE